MTIRRTAYETSACAGALLHKTQGELSRASIMGNLSPLENTDDVMEVQPRSDVDAIINAIPSFAHPMLFEGAHQKEMQLAIDVRAFGSYDRNRAAFFVRNTTEYNLLVARAKLNKIWLTQTTSIVRDLSALPLGLYSSWVSEAVARRFGLDPQEQLNLAILAGIFYLTLFSDENLIEHEQSRLKLVSQVSRGVRVSAEMVLAVVDQLYEGKANLNTLNDFVVWAEPVTHSVRLKDFNVGLLFSIMGGTWFGTNAKELVAVALEHPPTWMIIVLAATQERTFKNSVVAQLADRGTFKDLRQDYQRSLIRLLETQFHH